MFPLWFRTYFNASIHPQLSVNTLAAKAATQQQQPLASRRASGFRAQYGFLTWYCARFEYFSPRKSRRYSPLLLLVQKYIKPSEYLELLRGFYHRDSRFFLLLQRITIKELRIDLLERLKRSARMHFDSLSLLKVESTVCFQRKRRRERAVTRERYASFAAKNLESIPNLAQPCSAFVPDLRRVVIQSHYRVDRRSRGLAV